jgi:cardiolipin synthase A/B
MDLIYFLSYSWWELLLLAAGIIGISTAILNLFFSLGDRLPLRATRLDVTPDSEDFLLALAHSVNSPIEEGGEVEVLNNGKEFLPILLRDLRNAERSINITTYIWSAGKMSDQIFRVLVDRARKGVQIRILRDGFGGLNAPWRQMHQLKKLGAKVHSFRSPEFGKLTRLHRRAHRRAIVIDGKIGYTGGMAVDDKWLGNADSPDHWRDIMFRLNGPMARSLQAVFSDIWTGTNGEILVGEEFYPSLPVSRNTGMRFVTLASSPSDDTKPLPKLLWLTIMAARKNIYISTPYFVPDENIAAAIINQAKKGVDVRLLVPSASTDSMPARWAGHKQYEDMLGAGVRIFEYQPTMLHSKAISVDGIWSVIGSFNLDIRSKELNEENALGIQNEDFADILQDIFLKDLTRAKEITLAEWRKRGILHRILERIFGFFSEQF